MTGQFLVQVRATKGLATLKLNQVIFGTRIGNGSACAPDILPATRAYMSYIVNLI